MSIIEEVGMKELLEAGVHFGHKSVGWNPNMKEYIFMKKKGVHVIDLQKTLIYVEQAHNYVKNVVANGGSVLFVGTKKQAKSVIKESAQACGQYYIAQRWVGGLLTNFNQIRKSIKKIEDYEKILTSEDRFTKYTKKELIQMEKKMNRLNQTFEGIRKMNKLPDLMFVVDAFQEKVALVEARQMGILTVGMVDTNSDPSLVDKVIPGNDDAVRAIALLVGHMAHAVLEGLKFRNDTGEIMDSIPETTVKEEVVPDAVPLPEEINVEIQDTVEKKVEVEKQEEVVEEKTEKITKVKEEKPKAKKETTTKKTKTPKETVAKKKVETKAKTTKKTEKKTPKKEEK